MTAKIGYLIDNNAQWDEKPEWTFYEEQDVPRWKIEHASVESIRRIVYWEVEV